MIKTLEIISIIGDLILSVHPSAWPERAPKDAQFPYVTFDLATGIDQSELEQFMLNVDGWDAPADGSPAVLETMMVTVDKVLNGAVIMRPEAVAVAVYRETRLRLEDSDPRIRRRRYTYQVRTFEGS